VGGADDDGGALVYGDAERQGKVPQQVPRDEHICDVTGAKPGFGNNVSHSHLRTRRRWDPNPHRRRFWLGSEGRHIRLTVSTKGLRVIDRDRIDAVVAHLHRVGRRI
jgi:large subunit ribosomal protein L28